MDNSRNSLSKGADAPLLLLGRAWEAAVVASRLAEAEYNAAHDDPSRAAELAERDCSAPVLAANDHLDTIEMAILDAPAATLAGLAIKASVVKRALRFHYDGDDGEPACRLANVLVDSISKLNGSLIEPDAIAA